jgi:hypothetical protein
LEEVARIQRLQIIVLESYDFTEDFLILMIGGLLHQYWRAAQSVIETAPKKRSFISINNKKPLCFPSEISFL